MCTVCKTLICRMTIVCLVVLGEYKRKNKWSLIEEAESEIPSLNYEALSAPHI